MKNKKYNGWLVSNSIIKRSFAVMGHYAIAMLMIYAVFILLVAVFASLGWLVS